MCSETMVKLIIQDLEFEFWREFALFNKFVVNGSKISPGSIWDHFHPHSGNISIQSKINQNEFV